MTLFVTPSQTVGPFFEYALPYEHGPDVVAPETEDALLLQGQVFDGSGESVPDALLEIWQVDSAGQRSRASGVYDIPARWHRGFRGFGRCGTDTQGHYWFRTVRPGQVRTADGHLQAPHIAVTVFARGLLRQLVTRVYFPDEEDANATDPLLASLEPPRRTTLIASADADGFRFDIHLRDEHGAKETVFLDVFEA